MSRTNLYTVILRNSSGEPLCRAKRRTLSAALELYELHKADCEFPGESVEVWLPDHPRDEAPYRRYTNARGQ